MMFRRFVLMVSTLPVSGENINYSYTGTSQDLGVVTMPDGQFRLIRFTTNGILSFLGRIGKTLAQACVINGGKSGYTGGTGPNNPAYTGEVYAGRGGDGSSVLSTDVTLKNGVSIVVGQSDQSSSYDNVTAQNTNKGGYGGEAKTETLYDAQNGVDGLYPFGYTTLGKHGASGGGGGCANADGVGSIAGQGGNDGGGDGDWLQNGTLNASFYGAGGGGGSNDYWGHSTPGGTGYQGCVYLRIPVL